MDKMVENENIYPESYSSIQILRNTTTGKYYLHQYFEERYVWTLHCEVLIELQYVTVDSNGNIVFDNNHLLIDGDSASGNHVYTDSTMSNRTYMGGSIGDTAYYGGSGASQEFVGTYETITDAITLKSTAGIDYSITNSAFEIPSGVATIEGAFQNCSGIENVAKIPSSITNSKNCFNGCSSLETITDFRVPLSVLQSSSAQNAFLGCTSLVSIGFVINEAEDWHVWRLKFGSNTVEGEIFDRDKTSRDINEGTAVSITKSDLQLPILTDELWFPSSSMSDSDIDDLIEDMLDYHYGVFNKPVIPPNESNLVLWADDEDHFVTNIPMGGGSDWATIKQNIADELGLTASQYDGNSATATTAYKVRVGTPATPENGDIWVV